MSRSICQSEIERRIDKLSDKHAGLLSSFSCTSVNCDHPEHFNSYLSNALTEYNMGRGTTFVMCEYTGDKPSHILGFISLKATSCLYESETGKTNGEPAVEIAELAVDHSSIHQGIGSALVKYAFCVVNDLRDQIGIRYLVACASKNAIDFYLKRTNGFERCSTYFVIPRDTWNDDCIPVARLLPEVGLLSFISDEEDDEESDDF